MLNSTNRYAVGDFKFFVCLMTLPALPYVLDGLHSALVSLSRNVASNVTRVEDEVSDVTSVNTGLQQCRGKVVRLDIQFEINYCY